MSDNPEYKDYEKALALMAVIEIFGEEVTVNPEQTADLMELYLKGYYASKL